MGFEPTTLTFQASALPTEAAQLVGVESHYTKQLVKQGNTSSNLNNLCMLHVHVAYVYMYIVELLGIYIHIVMYRPIQRYILYNCEYV